MMFRGILLLGMLGAAVVWFLMRSSAMEEEETQLLILKRKRREIRERKMKTLEESMIYSQLTLSVRWS